MKFTKESWESCERADLMLRHAAEIEVDIRILTRAKAECAKTVEHLMKDFHYVSYSSAYADADVDVDIPTEIKEIAVIVRKAIPFEIIEKAQAKTN